MQEQILGLLPPGLRVYAIGDVHGRRDLLDALLDLIEEDHAKRGQGRLLLVFLGDYVDRGPQSRQVIDRLIRVKTAQPEARFLRGNHEDLLLSFLGRPEGSLVRVANGAGAERGLSWLMNGGDATLRSYGLPVEKLLSRFRFDPERLDRLRHAFLKALPEDHLDFLLDLESSVLVGDYYFVHAGVRPGIPLDEQSEEDRLWIRYEFLDSPENFGAIIVHGHTPAAFPEIRRNRIGIDTMAWQSGRLTALGLEQRERWFLSTGETR